MEINGIAHVMLTVSDFEACRVFWGRLLPELGLTPLIDSADNYYCIGGRTAIGIQRGDVGGRFDQQRSGLHHVCLRARERQDVDSLHELLIEMGATIVHPPREDEWAPGYYSLLFEDPDGIRVEMNHVPGKGWLKQD